MENVLDFKKDKNNVFFVFMCLLLLVSGCDRLTEKKDSISSKSSKSPSVDIKNTITEKELDVEVNGDITQNIKTSQNILSRVGSWSISLDQFNERLLALKEVAPEFDVTTIESKKIVLDELIRQQLIVTDAEMSGIAKNEDIKAAVEEFRRTLIVREIARKLTENISVSEKEMLAFYEENKEELIEPTDYSVSEIVVGTQLKANEILIEILKGVDFAEMAKTHSKSDSAPKGGNLGILKEVFFPEMGEELLTMDQGQVSKVLQGPDSKYYIFKLDKKSGGNVIDFDSIKDKIKENRLLNKQQKIILDYIEGLKNKITVETNEDLLIKG